MAAASHEVIAASVNCDGIERLHAEQHRLNMRSSTARRPASPIAAPSAGSDDASRKDHQAHLPAIGAERGADARFPTCAGLRAVRHRAVDADRREHERQRAERERQHDEEALAGDRRVDLRGLRRAR